MAGTSRSDGGDNWKTRKFSYAAQALRDQRWRRTGSVGYCKPPTTTRFQKGKSGNPRGRPKEAKGRLPAINEERMKSILIEEAYRARREPGSYHSDDTGGGPKHGAGGRERAGEIAAHVHCVAAGYGKGTEGQA